MAAATPNGLIDNQWQRAIFQKDYRATWAPTSMNHREKNFKNFMFVIVVAGATIIALTLVILVYLLVRP